MDRYKKKKSFQSKLNVDTLFNKVPMNLKCTMSQNERDFLEAVIHLQHLGRYHTSNSLIMANSGLNSRQISSAKQNLVQMGLIEVADNKSAIGTRYIVKDEVYNTASTRTQRHPDGTRAIRIWRYVSREARFEEIVY